MSVDARESKGSWQATLVVVIGAVFVLTVVGLTAAVGWSEDPAKRGTFGDMFGVASALFSGLAFVGLIATVLLQRRELSLQRQELSLTRVELSGQRAALEAQVDAMSAQAFEAAFFARIEFLGTVMRSVRAEPSHSEKEVVGDRAWKRVSYSLEYPPAKFEGLPAEIAAQAFRAIDPITGVDIGPTIRLTEEFLRFLEGSARDTTGYERILGAVFTEDQLEVLMAYSLTQDGAAMKAWIESSGALRPLRGKGLKKLSACMDEFAPSAFGE